MILIKQDWGIMEKVLDIGEEYLAELDLDEQDSKFSPSPLPVAELKNILKAGDNLELIEKKYGYFDIDGITGVQYSPYDDASLLRRSVLHRLTLKGERPIPLELISKIGVEDEEVIDISNRLHESVRESAIFQYNQMKFWNTAKLPAPLVLGLRHRREEGHDCYYLVMEFWPGPTHDLNLLALRQARKSLDTAGVMQRDLENILNNYRAAIDGEVETIVKSAIDAVRTFHLVGTKEIKKPVNERFNKKVMPVNVEEFYLDKRGLHYLKLLTQYLSSAGFSGNGRNNKRVGMEELEKRFIDSFRVMLRPFNEKNRLYYAQGDEYFHHSQFLSRNGERKSGLFDADHVTWTRPEYSHAKMLTSHLLGLSKEDELRYAIYAFFPDDRNEKYDRRLFTRDGVIRDYVLASIKTRFFDIGKRASDGIRNRERSETLCFGGVPFPKMHKLNFPVLPHVPSAVNYPSVPETINLQKRALEDRFNAVENRDAGYGLITEDERGAVLRLRGILGEIGLY